MNIIQEFNRIYEKNKVFRSEETVPVSIFCNTKHGVIEALIIYLREYKHRRNISIGKLLNRHNKGISDVYIKAKKKGAIIIEPSEAIPIEIFKEKISPYRALIKYLINTKEYKINQVAKLLGTSYNNVWIAYSKVRDC